MAVMYVRIQLSDGDGFGEQIWQLWNFFMPAAYKKESITPDLEYFLYADTNCKLC